MAGQVPSTRHCNWYEQLVVRRQHIRSVQITHDDKVLLIKDGYPKARFHILVIARDPALLDISCLRSRHVPLLTHMRGKAEEWFASKKVEVGVVRLHGDSCTPPPAQLDSIALFILH